MVILTKLFLQCTHVGKDTSVSFPLHIDLWALYTEEGTVYTCAECLARGDTCAVLFKGWMGHLALLATPLPRIPSVTLNSRF